MIRLSGSLKTGTDTWLFQDIDLSMQPQGWTCLLGPSGVGKTTILRLLAGLEIHGTFIGTLENQPGESTLSCAYMAQQDLLMPWLNVTDNVCLGARLRGHRPDLDQAQHLIEAVGLSADREKVPGQLSGGMRQRVSLARTLMEERPVILLDEPFSALDARTRAEMQELSHRLLNRKSVLLVTHDPAEAARIGDRNLILDESGLREMENKETRDIIAVDAQQTLRLQSVLFEQLRSRRS